VPTSLTFESKLWSKKCDGGPGCALPLSELAAEGSHIARLVAPVRCQCVPPQLGLATGVDLKARMSASGVRREKAALSSG
jgi:hypothetical protein